MLVSVASIQPYYAICPAPIPPSSLRTQPADPHFVTSDSEYPSKSGSILARMCSSAQSKHSMFQFVLVAPSCQTQKPPFFRNLHHIDGPAVKFSSTLALSGGRSVTTRSLPSTWFNAILVTQSKGFRRVFLYRCSPTLLRANRLTLNS